MEPRSKTLLKLFKSMAIAECCDECFARVVNVFVVCYIFVVVVLVDASNFTWDFQGIVEWWNFADESNKKNCSFFRVGEKFNLCKHQKDWYEKGLKCCFRSNEFPICTSRSFRYIQRFRQKNCLATDLQKKNSWTSAFFGTCSHFFFVPTKKSIHHGTDIHLVAHLWAFATDFSLLFYRNLLEFSLSSRGLFRI